MKYTSSYAHVPINKKKIVFERVDRSSMTCLYRIGIIYIYYNQTTTYIAALKEVVRKNITFRNLYKGHFTSQDR